MLSGLIQPEILLESILEPGPVENGDYGTASDTGTGQVEVEALPCEIDVQAVGQGRSSMADVGKVVGTDDAVTVNILILRIAVGIHSLVYISVEVPYRISGLESGQDLVVTTTRRVGSHAWGGSRQR